MSERKKRKRPISRVSFLEDQLPKYEADELSMEKRARVFELKSDRNDEKKPVRPPLNSGLVDVPGRTLTKQLCQVVGQSRTLWELQRDICKNRWRLDHSIPGFRAAFAEKTPSDQLEVVAWAWRVPPLTAEERIKALAECGREWPDVDICLIDDTEVSPPLPDVPVETVSDVTVETE